MGGGSTSNASDVVMDVIEVKTSIAMVRTVVWFMEQEYSTESA